MTLLAVLVILGALIGLSLLVCRLEDPHQREYQVRQVGELFVVVSIDVLGNTTQETEPDTFWVAHRQCCYLQSQEEARHAPRS